jgi:hypothetical protein
VRQYGRVRVRLERDLSNDTEASSTAASQRPEQIRVGELVGDFELAVCCDDLELKKLVDAKSEV